MEDRRSPCSREVFLGTQSRIPSKFSWDEDKNISMVLDSSPGLIRCLASAWTLFPCLISVPHSSICLSVLSPRPLLCCVCPGSGEPPPPCHLLANQHKQGAFLDLLDQDQTFLSPALVALCDSLSQSSLQLQLMLIGVLFYQG